MRAEESSLKGILEGEPHKLEVPFFQRKYVWKEENWKELLESIENFGNDKAFWGSIIIKKSSVMDVGKKYSKGYIIDGQQRLTTIALLTKAIYDSLSPEDKERARDIIKNYVFFSPRASASFEKQEYEIIIKHSRVDNQDFETIIKTGVYDENEIDVEADDYDKKGHIKRCYAYYRKVLKEKTNREILDIMDTLYGDDKVFVYITLEENDINEQKIFDAINRAGQKLFTSDIIKNNLFKRLIDKGVKSEEAGAICDKYWDKIFAPGDDDNFWDKKRQFGNVGKSHLDFLLYCVACIEWSNVDVKRVNEKLESVYEQETAEYSAQEIKELIKKIADIALIYKKYIIDFGENIENICFSKKDDVQRLLLIMDKFKIQMFYPYVLKRLKDNVIKKDYEKGIIECNLDDEKLKMDFFILESYLIRRRICGESTSAYSKICNEIIKTGISDLINNMSDNDIEREDKEIMLRIRESKKQDTAKMVLFCIELTKWDEKDDVGQLQYNYQLEHIMPQKWQKYWSLETEKNVQENIDKRDSAIYEIGNMLLLSQKLNKHIQNREYAKKMEGEEATGKCSKKEGYMDKTQLKMTKKLVDSYNEGDRSWDEEHIYKRTREIGEDILEHWNLKALKSK